MSRILATALLFVMSGVVGTEELSGATAKTDSLVLQMLSMAEQMTLDTGSIEPIVAIMQFNGDMHSFIGEELSIGLKAIESRDKYLAVGLLQPVVISNEGEKGASPGVAITVSNIDGYSDRFFLPYRVSEGQFFYGERIEDTNH